MINNYELKYEHYVNNEFMNSFTNFFRGSIEELDESMYLKGYTKIANYYFKSKDEKTLKVRIIKHKVELNC